jgi:hypothetical protein
MDCLRDRNIFSFLLLFFVFLLGLVFELRASHLQSNHLNHTSSPFFSAYFGDGFSNYLPKLALTHNPPDLILPSS